MTGLTIADLWNPEEKQPTLKQQVFFLTLDTKYPSCKKTEKELMEISGKIKSGYFHTLFDAVKAARKVIGNTKIGVTINSKIIKEPILKSYEMC